MQRPIKNLVSSWVAVPLCPAGLGFTGNDPWLDLAIVSTQVCQGLNDSAVQFTSDKKAELIVGCPSACSVQSHQMRI
jgi:hypothetical protein